MFVPTGRRFPVSQARIGDNDACVGVIISARSPVFTLDDIIRSKEATGRAKDEDDVLILRAWKDGGKA